MKPESFSSLNNYARQSLMIWGGIILVCLVAFIAIAVITAQVSEYLPHSEDEAAYLFQAKVFAQNRLTVPTPPVKDAFWSPFVLDYQGQRFGKYPPGWPFLLSLGVRWQAPWLINAGMGAVTLGLIGWLADRFYCRHSRPCFLPLLAAGLGLVTPAFLLLSSSLLSHTASLFWTTSSLIALFYLTMAGAGQQEFSAKINLAGLLLGGCLGALFITRPFAALGIGLAIGVFVLTTILKKNLNWTVLLWIGLGGAPIASALPVYWWLIGGSPTFNPYLLVWSYDQIGFGPDVGPHGYTWHDAIFINTRLKLTTLAAGLFGWPGWSSLLFLPVPFLIRQQNRWDWLLLGTIVSLVFVHIFYWAFGGVDGGFPRYYYDALPAFLLLTGRGIQLSGRLLGRWQRSLRWLPLGLVIIFTGYAFIWRLPPLLAAQKGKYGITPKPLKTVEQAQFSEPVLILVQNVESWSDFAAPFAALSPTLDGPVIYAIDWNDDTARQLRAHFAGRECWLLSNAELRPCPKTTE